MALNVLDIVKAVNLGAPPEEIERIKSAVLSGDPDAKGYDPETYVAEEGFRNVVSQEITPPNPVDSMQANALPSLPSISNVGTISPTGTVNRQAVPGGFQPLPQMAGGKKKLYQLSQFHGGINQKSSQRDISDQECKEAINVTFSNIGRIKILGDLLNTNAVGADVAADSIDENLPGYGLFQFTAPADQEGTAGEEVITCTANGSAVDVYSAGGGVDADFITTVGSTDSTDVAQIYYAAGNGLYAANANFDHGGQARCKIYVSRADINGTVAVSGWSIATSSPLITSPTRAATNAANSVSLENAATAASNNGEMAVQVEPTGTGTWAGIYNFYVSYLFDGGCESGLTSLGTDEFTSTGQGCEFNVSIKHHASSYHVGNDKRIEGARIYFKPPGESERYLLTEISLVDGVKGATDSTFTPWDTDAAPVYDLSSDMIFTNPPQIYTFASLNGYYANEVYSKSPDAASDGIGPIPLVLNYKTVAVGQNGIVYVGNVRFDGKHKPDAMMFSMPGKPAVFPKFNTFDSPSSDGSPITALASFQDTILQFKQNSLFIINVSNPQQFYAEQVYKDCGVFNPCQVFTTSFGVIFANKHGCFIYDGQSVISLTSGKFDWINQSGIQESTMNNSTAVCPSVGYDPRSQSIIVLKAIGDDSTDSGGAIGDEAWIYNMITQSWTEAQNFFTNTDGRRHTNFIITSDGYLAHKIDNDGTLLNYNQGQANGNAQTITYITKDLDFGLPSQTKKIFKIYVSYLGDGSSVSPTFGTNSDSPTNALTNAEDSSTTLTNAGTNDIQIATLTSTDSSLIGCYSLQLKFAGSAGEDFEIHDISIVYRQRPVK